MKKTTTPAVSRVVPLCDQSARWLKSVYLFILSARKATKLHGERLEGGKVWKDNILVHITEVNLPNLVT